MRALGVSGAWCIIAFRRMCFPTADTLYHPCGGYSLRDHVGNSSTHSLSERCTLPPPKRVAIDRYQCVRVLQAHFVSVISTDDSRYLLLFAALSACQTISKFWILFNAQRPTSTQPPNLKCRKRKRIGYPSSNFKRFRELPSGSLVNHEAAILEKVSAEISAAAISVEQRLLSWHQPF